MRPVTVEDAEAIYNYRSDPIVNRYQGFIPTTILEVQEFIECRISPEIDVPGTWFQLVILEKASGQIIGDVGVHFLDSGNCQCEIGYTLDSNYQGRGYATEAVSAIITFLMEKLNKRRIIATMDPRNTRSIQLVERLGFRREAHFRESVYYNNEWCDDLVYAILKDEWRTRIHKKTNRIGIKFII